jgi:hypothetical protein
VFISYRDSVNFNINLLFERAPGILFAEMKEIIGRMTDKLKKVIINVKIGRIIVKDKRIQRTCEY